MRPKEIALSRSLVYYYIVLDVFLSLPPGFFLDCCCTYYSVCTNEVGEAFSPHVIFYYYTSLYYSSTLVKERGGGEGHFSSYSPDIKNFSSFAAPGREVTDSEDKVGKRSCVCVCFYIMYYSSNYDDCATMLPRIITPNCTSASVLTLMMQPRQLDTTRLTFSTERRSFPEKLSLLVREIGNLGETTTTLYSMI